MSYLLWFVMALLSTIPAFTAFVYYHRRLGTRRQLLKQTLMSLQLEDSYMAMRHGEVGPADRAVKFGECFDRDFTEGLSAIDYGWPVVLATLIAAVGWFLTFSRVYPSFTAVTGAGTFLPDYFAYGFAGAFLAGVMSIFDDFRTFNLDPNVYYGFAYRMLFSSTAAYLSAQVFKDTFSPLVAFGIGLFPVQKAWKVITDKTAQAVGTANNEGEAGAALASIQGLDDQPNRQKLLEVDISTVEGLATADPFWLFFQTTFPLRTIVDMMDKAILYLYIGDTTQELRKHGINGVIDLVALVPLANDKAAFGSMDGSLASNVFFDSADVDKVIASLCKVLNQEPEELKTIIYNLYYDPLVQLLYGIWGRYLNPAAVTAVAPLPAAAATVALASAGTLPAGTEATA